MMLTDMAIVTAGGGFPWGLLIVGLILYFLWQKGVFDGRGRHGRWHDGGGYGPGYGPPRGPEGPGPGPAQGNDFGLRGPRDYFEEWHRQAHEAERAQAQQPAAPVTPAAPATPPQAPEAPAQGSGETPR